MPPLLIALATVALYFLLPKQQRTGGMTVVQTPNNTPIGINSGFVVPAAQSNGTPGPVAGVVNAPGVSQSGVPQSSPQAQKVVPAATVPQNQPSEFYSYPAVFSPTFTPTKVSDIMTSQFGSTGCGGCSGGCGGTPLSKPASDCATSMSRATNSGCLAPITKSLYTRQNAPFFDRWFANVASDPDANPFTVYRAFNQAQQYDSPLEEGNNVPPVGFVSPVIGLNAHTPRPDRVV